jgi:Membrane domain of glycerophosphoryl diester phosphodiesterase
VDLRPLTLAELLDRAFSTYRQHLWLFVGIMAVPAVWAMTSAVAMELFKGAAGPGGKPEEMLLRTGVLLLGAFAFGVFYMLAYAFALGATTVAVSHLYMGRETSVGAAYSAVRRHGGRLVLLLFWGWLRLFLTMMGIFALGIFLGLVLASVSPLLNVFFPVIALLAGLGVSLFLLVRWGVAVPAIVLEDLSANASLARSVELTEDNRGRVFLVMLCAVVITYATVLLLQVPFIIGATLAGPGTPLSVALGVAGAVLGGIGSMFSGPIMIIGLAMMYYDLRIRKEALDLQVMLEALDPPAGS